MAFPKYADLIKLTKEKLGEAMAAPRAREQGKKAELEMAKLDTALASLDQKANELAAQYPINWDSLLQTLDEKALTERRRAQFATLIAELFPAE